MLGIIGAMEEEIKLLRNCMEMPETVNTGVFEFFRGKIDGKDTVLLRSGIGKTAAAVGSALLIHIFKPDYIINTGSAGGIDPKLHFGDVIISTGLIYHDVDVTAFNYAPGQLPAQPQIFPVDESLGSIAEQSISELKQEKKLPDNLNYCRGIIGSADTFMHETQSLNGLRQRFPEIAAVDMESAAVAHCCRLFSVPVIVIRALSDIAGTESPLKFNEFLPIASKHCAEIVRRIILLRKD